MHLKLKQDFLQTGRNILPIQLMNDSSDDTNIKVMCFPNRTFALRVFPSSITFPAETIFLMEYLLTPVAAAVFAITAPALTGFYLLGGAGGKLPPKRLSFPPA